MAEDATCEIVNSDNSCQNSDETVNPTSVCDTENANKDSFKVPEGLLKPIDKTKKLPEYTLDSGRVGHSHDVDGDSKQQSEIPNVKPINLSPAEILKQPQVVFPYKEPAWSGLADAKYSFEVLKNGAIIDNIDLTKKPYYVFGRLPSCDYTLEHPSLSRYHAVLQYCGDHNDEHNKGWYLYDLDSTHGTWVNKIKVKPKIYHRVRVGHVVKFGGSTRLHVLQGPDDDQEEESNLTVSELKEQRERQKREVEFLRQAELHEEQLRASLESQNLDSEGCSWGISEDAEEPVEGNPLISLVAKDEHLYVDDPKKALKGYFEREGYDLPDYQFVEAAIGKHKCTVELPVDSPTGEPIVAEAIVSGKRKDAVVQCALEACRILDKLGVLRASKHESRERKGKNWEDDDFYDSDEDTFLDRTGTIEKKRILRMKKMGKAENKTETYESLLEKHKDVSNQIEEIENKLAQAKADATVFENEEEDALDAYMSAIKCGVMDTKTRMNLKCQLIELKKDEMRLRSLVNIAKPATLPEIIKPTLQSKTVVQPNPALVGRMKIHKTNLKKFVVQPVDNKPEEDDSDDEEEEEEDEEQRDKKSSVKEKKDPQTSDDKLHESIPDKVADCEKITQKQTETKIKGPSQPSPDINMDVALSKKPTKRSSNDLTTKSVTKKSKSDELSVDYDASDPDYAVWLPPKGQSGDGKTHLNEKFGY